MHINTHSSAMTKLRGITIVYGKCTYLYNESPCNEIWPLIMHFNMNKSSSKCKPSYIIQPMSSILCGLLVNTSLQSCQSHIATTMSQYGHFRHNFLTTFAHTLCISYAYVLACVCSSWQSVTYCNYELHIINL